MFANILSLSFSFDFSSNNPGFLGGKGGGRILFVAFASRFVCIFVLVTFGECKFGYCVGVDGVSEIKDEDEEDDELLISLDLSFLCSLLNPFLGLNITESKLSNRLSLSGSCSLWGEGNSSWFLSISSMGLYSL